MRQVIERRDYGLWRSIPEKSSGANQWNEFVSEWTEWYNWFYYDTVDSAEQALVALNNSDPVKHNVVQYRIKEQS